MIYLSVSFEVIGVNENQFASAITCVCIEEDPGKEGGSPRAQFSLLIEISIVKHNNTVDTIRVLFDPSTSKQQ